MTFFTHVLTDVCCTASSRTPTGMEETRPNDNAINRLIEEVRGLRTHVEALTNCQEALRVKVVGLSAGVGNNAKADMIDRATQTQPSVQEIVDLANGMNLTDQQRYGYRYPGHEEYR